jgi:triacylglycerol esterase/lipase EstA (alpha/beta hydrolase family)
MFTFPSGKEDENELLEVPETINRQTIDISELVRIIENDIVPRMSGSPAVWFTGHSMGAALSTLVLSHLIYKQSSLTTKNVSLHGHHVEHNVATANRKNSSSREVILSDHQNVATLNIVLL